MEIEKLATSAVEAEISKTERLSSFINSGDKEPSWDGNVYIHSDKKHNKKGLKKVSTQIKGKEVASAKKKIITYPVSLVDLDAYMNNGGTMFFVVYIDKNTGDALKIYYSSLLPFKIMELKKNSNAKKSINVEFCEYPKDNKEKTEIFLNFYSHRNKQMSFVGKEIPSIEELEKQGVLTSLSVSYMGVSSDRSPLRFPKVVDGKEMYLYANIKNGIAPIPVQYVSNVQQVALTQENNMPVFVGDRQFYDRVKVVTMAEKYTISVDDCVTITSPIDPQPGKEYTTINIRIKGTLNQRIKRMEFVKALLENKSFKLGGITVPSDFPTKELEKLQADTLDERIDTFKKIQQVLDRMSVKLELDVDKCSESDFNKLRILVDAIEDNKQITINEDYPIIVNFNISNLHLVLTAEKVSKGVYKFHDFFGEHFSVMVMDDDNNPHPTSQFSILKKDDFFTVHNMNYKRIVEDFKSIHPAQEHVIDRANLVLLEMLSAYDEQNNDELLSAAEEMAEWLKTQPNYLPADIAELNYLQIIKRKRSLSFSEKGVLNSIVQKTDNTQHKLGAMILLDEHQEAKTIFASLDKKDADNFQQYPIYYFERKFEEDNNNG